MGFRMIAPKRVRKVKTQNGQEVLRRLEQYLESAAVTGDPVEILCGFWEDQKNAITYQELRQAVLDGALTAEAMELWRQDYSILVSGRLRSMWEKAIGAGAKGQPILDGIAFEFNSQSQGILNWINERGAEFVTACTQEQTDAIAALLTKKMREGHTVDELSRLIRPCIGLTEGDAKAAARLYDSIVANLKKEHPRMKPESIRKKALDATQKYAERKHRARAMTIAQTESAFAYNHGADVGIRQAQAEGLLGVVKKRWSTSGDDSVCPICASLEGVEIGMEDSFGYKGRVLFPGQKKLPPAHPRCACAVEYIEVSPPVLSGTENMGVSPAEEEADSNMQKLGEVDPGKTGEALGYYGDLFRDDMVENVIVIDRAGSVYHAAGGAANVNISGIGLAGASITHNHPESNGILSFGQDDFMFLKENPDIAELQAVNKYYTYRAVPLDKIKEISYNEIYREALIRGMGAGGEDLQHLAMEVLAEKGGVIYARKAVK